MGEFISIIHGMRGRRNPEDGTRLASRCQLCQDAHLRQFVHSRRTNHPGGPLFISTILVELNRESSRQGGATFTHQQLETHFQIHESDAIRVTSIVSKANHNAAKFVRTRGVPRDILAAVPKALDPSLPIIDTHINLASLIRRGEEMLGRVERRIDNAHDETLDIDHPTALAAHGYLLNTLRNFYATIHKLADPRRMVMLFLVNVARAMMDDVVEVAQQCFHELATECVAGLEPADRIRVQAAVINRGRAFASSLDGVASSYDAQLVQIANPTSGEDDAPSEDNDPLLGNKP